MSDLKTVWVVSWFQGDAQRAFVDKKKAMTWLRTEKRRLSGRFPLSIKEIPIDMTEELVPEKV